MTAREQYDARPNHELWLSFEEWQAKHSKVEPGQMAPCVTQLKNHWRPFPINYPLRLDDGSEVPGDPLPIAEEAPATKYGVSTIETFIKESYRIAQLLLMLTETERQESLQQLKQHSPEMACVVLDRLQKLAKQATAPATTLDAEARSDSDEWVPIAPKVVVTDELDLEELRRRYGYKPPAQQSLPRTIREKYEQMSLSSQRPVAVGGIQSANNSHVVWFPKGTDHEDLTLYDGWYFWDEAGQLVPRMSSGQGFGPYTGWGWDTELEAIRAFEQYAKSLDAEPGE